jgi:hypothetical protein
VIRRLIALAMVLSATANSFGASNSDIWRRKPAGMVAVWDFSGGRLTSPTGHTGTLVGNASVPARYLSVDGVGDFMQVADSTEFSFTDGSGTDLPWSIVAWINMTDATSFRIVSKATNFSSPSEWFFGTNPSDQLVIAIYGSGSTANNIAMTSNSALTALQGQWVFVAATYSGNESTTGLSLYISGSAVAATGTTSGVYTGTDNTSADVTIGCIFRDGPATYANGLISGIPMFNRVLLQTEIAQIYNTGSARISNGGTP